MYQLFTCTLYIHVYMHVHPALLSPSSPPPLPSLSLYLPPSLPPSRSYDPVLPPYLHLPSATSEPTPIGYSTCVNSLYVYMYMNILVYKSASLNYLFTELSCVVFKVVF